MQAQDAVFITLDSKIILKDGVLTEKRLKMDTGRLDRSLAFIAAIIYLGLCLHKILVEEKYWFVIAAALGLSWLVPMLKRFYQSVFVKTWNNYFRLTEIKTITTKPLENGLETEMILHLKNGRKKYLIFRDAENQVESFLHLANPARA